MGEVIKFRRPSVKEHPKPTAPEGGVKKGSALCRSGFHKWQVVNERPFDVKHGKLVTQLCCSRCGATRTEKR